jgi:hypothetical protein
MSRVPFSVVSHLHQHSSVVEGGPGGLGPREVNYSGLAGCHRAPRNPALGTHARYDRWPRAMIALVHLDRRAHHCDGNQREKDDLEWKENDRTFSSRANPEEADQFPSSDDVSREPEEGQWYLRVTECLI